MAQPASREVKLAREASPLRRDVLLGAFAHSAKDQTAADGSSVGNQLFAVEDVRIVPSQKHGLAARTRSAKGST